MARGQALHYLDFRPLRKGEGGYSPTARKYVSPSTGEVISIRQFQTLAHKGERYETRAKRAAILHGTPPKTYRKGNKDAYKRFLATYVEKENKKRATQGLAPITRGEARTNDDFKSAYHDLVLEGKRKKKDRSPGGRLARALEDLGLRDEGADYPVGETPD